MMQMRQIQINIFIPVVIGIWLLWPNLLCGQSVNTENHPDSLTFLLTRAPDSTFGYFIFKRGEMMIEQISIPGLQGLKGFSRLEDAEKTAGLVVEKIRKKEFPPSVTVADLKELGIPEALAIKQE